VITGSNGGMEGSPMVVTSGVVNQFTLAFHADRETDDDKAACKGVGSLA